MATDEASQEENKPIQFKSENFEGDEQDYYFHPDDDVVQEKKKNNNYKKPSQKNKRKQKLLVIKRDDDFEIKENLLYCQFCEYGADMKNLKNHLLNHFKDSLFQLLPIDDDTFSCPECQAPHRDKITLLRHFGWKHNMIYKFASKDDLKPRKEDQPMRDPESAKPEPMFQDPGESTMKQEELNVKVENEESNGTNHEFEDYEYMKTFLPNEGKVENLKIKLRENPLKKGKDFKCDQCSKTFSCSSNMIKHKRTNHKQFKL